MSKTQRYKLLTTCIVAALHPNQQQPAGAVWEPDNTNDALEAQALRNVGYAEETNVAPTHQTVMQQQAGEARKVLEDPDADGHEDAVELQEVLAGNVDEVTAELENLDDDQLTALAGLEAAGKNRKGVHDAIEQYRAARAE